MIRLLLVDDDLTNSGFLVEYLKMEDFEVHYARDGKEGWVMYKKWGPDLILLDVNMPGMDGFELARRIRETDPKVVIFFLTDRVEKKDRLYGFSLKGNDYIPKPFYPEELVAKIRERFASADTYKLYHLGDTIFDPGVSTVSFEGKANVLTQRQSEILTMLADREGRMVPRGEILTKVWGDDSFANSLALNVQITHLRNLLAADNSLKITSLRKRGYILEVKRVGGEPV